MNSDSLAVVGLQWGDEGKGKIIDYLASRYDCIIRFQGGSNAGHTIVRGGEVYKLSSLPSGIINDSIISIIASGVVVDPVLLMEEISVLTEQGISIHPNKLLISENCHVVLSLHKELDSIYNKNSKIGTTSRGIGTCYEDKIARRGIRLCDLRDKPSILNLKIENLVNHHNILRKGTNSELLNIQKIIDEVNSFRENMLTYVKKIHEIHKVINGKRLLFEGAQGALLDIDYGTYPFVTSSSTVSAFSSGFIHPKNVFGVIKAYSTRVGNGPFITEQINEIGTILQVSGNEFGTITNRKRRCGWFDAVAVKHAISITNANCLILTKIDVLDVLPVIKICNSYSINGVFFDYFPSSIFEQENTIPNYIEVPGWEMSTASINNFSDLPVNAKNYIKTIEDVLNLPIIMISTGSCSTSTILRKEYF